MLFHHRCAVNSMCFTGFKNPIAPLSWAIQNPLVIPCYADTLFLLLCFTVQGQTIPIVFFHCARTHYSFCFVSLYRDIIPIGFFHCARTHYSFCFLSLCKDTIPIICFTVPGHYFYCFVSLCQDTIPIVLFHCARTLVILFCFTMRGHSLAPFASTLFTLCISCSNKMNLICCACNVVWSTMKNPPKSVVTLS